MEWLKDKLNGAWKDFQQSWKSWTVWINAIGLGAIEFITQVLPYIAEELHKPDYADVIPAPWITMFLRAYFIVNILLRFKTDKALRDK